MTDESSLELLSFTEVVLEDGSLENFKTDPETVNEEPTELVRPETLQRSQSQV